MKLIELTQYLEELIPLSWQESYDNSGLLVGDPHQEISGALVSLDCTEAVLEEAIALNYNLIVSHHPLIFKGIKRITGADATQRIIMKAIRNGIAIYAAHTNLDNYEWGVNAKIAQKIGITNTRILSPAAGKIKQLVVYVPHSHVDAVKSALFEAGAGQIGKYQECSFGVEGKGTFKAKPGAQPFLGQIGEVEVADEVRLELVFSEHLEGRVLDALRRGHPYQEIAYQLFTLENAHQGLGAGMIGELETPLEESAFLELACRQLNTRVIRHTALLGRSVKRVAVCGGSGSFLLKPAIRAGADAFITGDFKYHEFFDAEEKLLIMDVGHFESEQFTQELLMEIIQKKFPNFAVRLTEVNTNPINYYY